MYTIHNNKTKEITDYMRQHQVDFLGMSETNTHWNDRNVFRKSLQDIRHGLQDNKA